MIGKQIVMYKGMIDGGGSGDDINARACYQIRIKPYEYGEFKATIFEKDLSSRLPIEFKGLLSGRCKYNFCYMV